MIVSPPLLIKSSLNKPLTITLLKEDFSIYNLSNKSKKKTNI